MSLCALTLLYAPHSFCSVKIWANLVNNCPCIETGHSNTRPATNTSTPITVIGRIRVVFADLCGSGRVPDKSTIIRAYAYSAEFTEH